jgi:hypothetical protein
MDELLQRAEQSVTKLDAQDAGQLGKGRKLSDAGTKARLFHEVMDARLGRIIEVDLKHEQLSWTINEAHLEQARLMDGKLMLVTNVEDLTPAEVGLSTITAEQAELFSSLKLPRPTTKNL